MLVPWFTRPLHSCTSFLCPKKRHNNVFLLWPYPQWPLFIFSYRVKVWYRIEFDSEIMPYQPLLTFLCPRPKVSAYEAATQFKWLMIFPLTWVFLFPQSHFSSLSLHLHAVLHRGCEACAVSCAPFISSYFCPCEIMRNTFTNTRLAAEEHMENKCRFS